MEAFSPQVRTGGRREGGREGGRKGGKEGGRERGIKIRTPGLRGSGRESVL
jgi:hypothetical protein